jgi:DNA primase
MSEEEKDSIGNHLKSKQYKKKKEAILQKADEIIKTHKEPTKKKLTPQEIQAKVDAYREQLRNENMQPPPPPTFVDEQGNPIFEDKSDIHWGGMPRRFKGTRAGLPPGELQPVQRTPQPQPVQRTPQPQPVQRSPPQPRPQPPRITPQEYAQMEKEFHHTTDLDFKDISGEEYREYMYNNGGVLRIVNPWKLAISKSGNHRIATLDGYSYIIAPNWIAIRFRKKVGEPSFAF